MISVGSIVLRVDDLARQTAFWTAALDYAPRDERSDDFVLLRPKNGIGPNVSLDRQRSTLQIPPRIHLDLYADDQAGEVKRLIALGATEVLGCTRTSGQWARIQAASTARSAADLETSAACAICSIKSALFMPFQASDIACQCNVILVLNASLRRRSGHRPWARSARLRRARAAARAGARARARAPCRSTSPARSPACS